jgi:hypothetical protein
MDGKQSGWAGRTFVVRIDPTVIYPLFGGYGTRLYLIGSFTLDSLYIGPVSARDPFMASVFYQCTFNGGDESVIIQTDAQNNFIIGQTDSMPIGIDGSRGLLISGFLDPDGDGLVATQSAQLGWQSRYITGDYAADLDKRTGYVDSTAQFNAIAVNLVDGYYTPPSVQLGIFP